MDSKESKKCLSYIYLFAIRRPYLLFARGSRHHQRSAVRVDCRNRIKVHYNSMLLYYGYSSAGIAIAWNSCSCSSSMLRGSCFNMAVVTPVLNSFPPIQDS